MQNSELFRRGIVAPLTQAAMESLLASDVDADIQIEWIEIEGDQRFYDYWAMGLFEKINARAGAIIDDYEEEAVPPNKIAIIVSVIEEELKSDNVSGEFLSFVSRFLRLARLAQDKEMPMFFIF